MSAAPTQDPPPRDPLHPPRVRAAWHPACASDALGDGLLTTALYGVPLVLFRGPDGAPAALVDRCPHRNVPLSAGRLVPGGLACGYHGWRFDPRGRCTAIPGLVGEPDAPGRRCGAHATAEVGGLIWVWGEVDRPPRGAPPRSALHDDPRYGVVRQHLIAEGSVLAVAENALDVPHTAFAHGGLFRVDRDRAPITCHVRRWADRAEAEYVGEQRPKGLVGRVLSPGGGEVVHFDRFTLPGLVEVEYRIGDENHILVQAALQPLDDHRTAVHATVFVRARVPLWLARPFAEPVALHIFGQDQQILAAQTRTMRAFGEAKYASTELDLLGPHILRLLRRAEADGLPEPGDAGPEVEKTVTMLV